MNTSTLDREPFRHSDLPGRLNKLADRIEQIQSLARIEPPSTGTCPPDDPAATTAAFSSSKPIATLMRESLNDIERTTPQLLPLDIDIAAELVDLGRLLTRWLFDWDKIGADAEARGEVARIAGIWSQRVQEVAKLSSSLSVAPMPTQIDSAATT